jgi:hypothetical protein
MSFHSIVGYLTEYQMKISTGIQIFLISIALFTPKWSASQVVYTHKLIIQPIQVQGTSISADISTLEGASGVKAAAQKVWDQAGILLEWRTTSVFVSPTAAVAAGDYINVGTPQYVATFDNLTGDIVGHGGTAGSKIVNMWFVNDLRADNNGGDIAGRTDGSLIVMDNQGVKSGSNPVWRAVAHELGHTLLGDDLHTGSPSSSYLMHASPTEPTSFAQIGTTHLLFTAAQMTTIANLKGNVNSILTAIPEPADIAFGLGLVALVAAISRRRRLITANRQLK